MVPCAYAGGAVADGQRPGKIRHIGVSNVSVKQLEEARRICTVVSVQNEYNLENRASESVLKACEKLGIAFLPWYPLGAGQALKSAKVKSLARKRKATAAQIALAWLLAKSPVMLPIPGTSDLEHLERNAGAAELSLSPDEMKELN
jgi:aryl-alcohol dehydrogenase-like predicted oxidoreductase